MTKIKRISPRKEPVQRRSIELRDAILQAATYILKKDGPLGFTTNKVAERAGVNIASLYQYYPNKESLLFHLVEIEWASTFNAIFPILDDQSKSCRERLRVFIEKFYETEADEAALRHAVGAAGLLIEDTREYRVLIENTRQVFLRFMAEALGPVPKAEVQRKADFILNVITSFSDGMPTGEWTDLYRDARTMSEMLCEYFKIK